MLVICNSAFKEYIIPIIFYLISEYLSIRKSSLAIRSGVIERVWIICTYVTRKQVCIRFAKTQNFYRMENTLQNEWFKMDKLIIKGSCTFQKCIIILNAILHSHKAKCRWFSWWPLIQRLFKFALNYGAYDWFLKGSTCHSIPVVSWLQSSFSATCKYSVAVSRDHVRF